jgi:hypothetical protein
MEGASKSGLILGSQGAGLTTGNSTGWEPAKYIG